MRVAIFAGLVFASACAGARPGPVPVTIAAQTEAPRAGPGFGPTGGIERELAALRALDATSPGTRSERYAREVGLLSDLTRCGDARELAAEIATKGDDVAKRAAGSPPSPSRPSRPAESGRCETAGTGGSTSRTRAATRSRRSISLATPSS